jgi:CRISPR system Cascade subunit CasB
MSSKPFDREAAAAWSWWNQLQPRERGGRNVPGDRATLARLRRSSSVLDAAIEPATAVLYQKLEFELPERDLPRAAMLAGVLAHVRDETGEPVARAMGASRSGEGSGKLISPLRLRRLLAVRDPNELLTAFRRVVAILGNKVNVRDVSRQLIAWTDDRWGDISRTQFAFAYHDAGAFAPNSNTTDTEQD